MSGRVAAALAGTAEPQKQSEPVNHAAQNTQRSRARTRAEQSHSMCNAHRSSLFSLLPLALTFSRVCRRGWLSLCARWAAGAGGWLSWAALKPPSSSPHRAATDVQRPSFRRGPRRHPASTRPTLRPTHATNECTRTTTTTHDCVNYARHSLSLAPFGCRPARDSLLPASRASPPLLLSSPPSPCCSARLASRSRPRA